MARSNNFIKGINMYDTISLRSSLKSVSTELGILSYLIKIPRMHGDPHLHSYGVWPGNTSYLGGETFQGRSSGCGFKWSESILSTIGETLERYAPSFYDENDFIHSTYNNLSKPALKPEDATLYLPSQLESKRISAVEFTKDTSLGWCSTLDLTTGKEMYIPGQFIYMPYSKDLRYIISNTSTGLAAHTNYYKAILNALYEVIERDSFVITWAHQLVKEKIKITPQIKSFIDNHIPSEYDWHFFDMTYDLKIPSVFGICFGRTEYGNFVAVGTATRPTFGLALKKVIKEIVQAIPYFRHTLDIKKGWKPSDDFYDVKNFEDHSIFYLKRPDHLGVFDCWINAKPTKMIDLFETHENDDKQVIDTILNIFKEKQYPVLFKDLTTVDVNQLGFYSIKIYIPELIPLSGTYGIYFYRGDRLLSVPRKLGLSNKSIEELNPYPHPFP